MAVSRTWASPWKAIWGAIWSGVWGIASQLCNFSTYWNGTEFVNVDFEEKAPLNLINDVVAANLKSQVDLSDGVTRIFRLPKVKFSSTATDLEYVFAGHAGINSGGNGVLRILFSGTRLSAVWKRSDNTDKAQTPTIAANFDIDSDIYITVSNTEFSLTVDGVTATASSIFAGASLLSSIDIGAFAPNSLTTDCLCSSFDSTCTGFVSFVSNISDGKKFTSVNGDVFELKPDLSGNEQYPNYTPPPEDIIRVPATDGIQNNEVGDTVTFVESDISKTDYADGGINYLRATYTLESIASQKATLECISSTPLPLGDGSNITFIINTNGKFLYSARDAASVIILQVDGTITNALDGITKYVHEVIITPEGGTLYTFDFCINGLIDKTVVNVDLVNGFNLNNITVDGTGAAPHIGKVFKVESSKFAEFNLNTRLLPQGENQLLRYNADGKSIAIGNAQQIFPYELPDGSYLVSDSACPNNETSALLIDKDTDIALQDKDTGEFLFDKDVV